MDFTGIFFYAPALDMSGYGAVARNYVRAIDSAGLRLRLTWHGPDNSAALGKAAVDALRRHFYTDSGRRTLLIKLAAPDYGQFWTQEFERTVYEIGMTMCETERLPAGWDWRCGAVDEVWVPTQYNLRTFRRANIKTRQVPYCIDTAVYRPDRPFKYYQFPLPFRAFKFLYVSGFDHRKGYDLLVRAFCEEFHHHENVMLVLKLYVPSWNAHEDPLGEVIRHFPPPPRPQVEIINSVMPLDGLLDLYQSCNAFVSTERANGWNYPLMEAMALGIPTVAINWSGATEYLTADNCFLIEPEPEQEPVSPKLAAQRPQYAGMTWAKVQVATVRKALRLAFEDHKLRDEKTAHALADIREKYSCEAVGEKIKETLYKL